MKGEAKNFFSIFVTGFKSRFFIPVYQRNYDWQIDQCRRLFDDLEDLIRTKRESHFFGSIVSQAIETDIGSRTVIDGQQRVTTCFLLLFALVHQVKKGMVKCEEPETFVDRITEMYLVNKYAPKESRLRLKPIKKDCEALERIAEGKNDQLIESSNITVNYRYFLERIEKMEFSAEQLEKAFLSLIKESYSLKPETGLPSLYF